MYKELRGTLAESPNSALMVEARDGFQIKMVSFTKRRPRKELMVVIRRTFLKTGLPSGPRERAA